MNQITAIILIILISVSVVAFFVNLYNRLIMLKFNVEKAYGNIDVILKQRADEYVTLI